MRAAEHGHVHVLAWCRANRCPSDMRHLTITTAARRGHLLAVQWCRINGFPWDGWVCAAAAEGGHLELLQWCRANRCPWDQRTCVAAAENGRLEVGFFLFILFSSVARLLEFIVSRVHVACVFRQASSTVVPLA